MLDNTKSTSKNDFRATTKKLNPFIIMLSGETDKDSVLRALEAGANKFMMKPTPYKDIQAIL